MATTSRKGLEILTENQNLKPKRTNLTHFEGTAVASEDDLDGILRDVEKIEANARSCKDKPKWKPGIEFTPEDEKDLDQIFEDAERRKKEIEELLESAKSDNSDDDDDTSSISSSTSSDDSSDSDLDRLLDDVETHNASKRVTKAVRRQEKAMDNEMDKILEDVKRTESKAGFKR